MDCRDKVLTGSFDKTAKLWSSETGKCFHTYRGHAAEIVSFDNNIFIVYLVAHTFNVLIRSYLLSMLFCLVLTHNIQYVILDQSLRFDCNTL